MYIDALRAIGDRWHVTAAILNLGNATVEFPAGPVQITMDGAQAVRLMREIGADVMVPVHFEDWEHFKEDRDGLRRVFMQEGFVERVCWTVPGVPTVVY